MWDFSRNIEFKNFLALKSVPHSFV